MKVLGLIVGVLLLATACGGGDSGDGGSAGSGRDLFRQTVLGGNAGCITCHSLDADTTLVGPSMAGVGNRAPTRQPGVAGADYLRTSIIDPESFIVPGFDSGKMPTNWGEVLTTAEIDALVAYLAGLT